jgi:hypothetical protein
MDKVVKNTTTKNNFNLELICVAGHIGKKRKKLLKNSKNTFNNIAQ